MWPFLRAPPTKLFYGLYKKVSCTKCDIAHVSEFNVLNFAKISILDFFICVILWHLLFYRKIKVKIECSTKSKVRNLETQTI